MVAPVAHTSTSNVKKVMISSTARDLPEHRKEVLDACMRQGMFPIMMEHLLARDDDVEMGEGHNMKVKELIARRERVRLSGHKGLNA